MGYSILRTAVQVHYRALLKHIAVLVIISSIVSSVPSDAKKITIAQPQYDTAYLPIKLAVLQHALIANSNDPAILFQLLRRANKNGLSFVAYTTLDQMRVKHPKNAVILSEYCLAFQMASGDPSFSAKISTHDLSSAANVFETSLQQAKSLDPKLWLPYLIEGREIVDKPDRSLEGFAELKKAVALAPGLAVTHYYLGYAYLIGNPKFYSPSNAEGELKKASFLKPAMDDVPFSLLSLYTFEKRDSAKALKAKRQYLAILPKGVKYNFGSWTTKLLAMYPDNPRR